MAAASVTFHNFVTRHRTARVTVNAVPVAASSTLRPRAAAWRLPLILAGSGLLIVACYATMALSGPTVDRLVEEDSYFEWTGAIGLFVACGLYVAAYRAERGGPRLLRITTAGLAFMMFVGGGEEISWGQRLFGWGTPAGSARSTPRTRPTCTTSACCTACSTRIGCSPSPG